MAKHRQVIGIFLERSKGLLLRANAYSETDHPLNWEFDYLDQCPLTWHPEKPSEAIDGLRYFAEIARAHYPECKSIAVACYGPFQSLTQGSSDYGALHNSAAHLPLRGQSIPAIFEDVLGTSWTADRDTRLSVHTDANACALGQAMARKRPPDWITAHLCITEGVGMGMVRGTNIFPSALHPEIGLMPVQMRATDPLFVHRRSPPLYTVNLAQLTDNRSMFARLRRMERIENPTLEQLLACKDEKLWDMRAFYLAQACLACAVLASPHQIVIGAEFDALKDVAQRTNTFFRRFMRARERAKQPVLHYTAFANPDFISEPKPIPDLPLELSLASTGAAGMCYAAADAAEGGDVVKKPNQRI